MALLLQVSHGAPFIWTTASGGNGHSYELITSPTPLTWTQARDASVALGGHLATLTSASENVFVWSIAGSRNPWIGGYQMAGAQEPAGGWQWVTGEQFIYTNWNAGEPNNVTTYGNEDKLQLYSGYGTWNDLVDNHPFAYTYSYVVEYESLLPPQKIYLAFNQDSSFGVTYLSKWVTGSNTNAWLPISSSLLSQPAAQVSETYRTATTSKIQAIFDRSGVYNIEWVLSDSSDAIVVYFCKLINPDLLGYSLQNDRFNSERRGKTIVFVDERFPDPDTDAQTAAHEIGHLLGLRHVSPSADEVMNSNGGNAAPRFTNTVSNITDPLNVGANVLVPQTHNPLYHLLRYVDGWSPERL